LTNLFEPKTRDCYQKAEVLPGLDEVSLDMDKVTLIVVEPTRSPHLSTKLSEDWHKFAEDQEFKNRVFFLTGSHETMERIIEQARQYKAILSIKAELDTDRISSRDPQYVEADKSLDQIQLSLRSSIQETFTTLVYPSSSGFRSTDCRIHFHGNNFDGETLIRDTLEKAQKFTTDISSDTFRKKCEARLFSGQKTSSWNEVRRRAATQMEWNFHHPKALEDLKKQMLDREVWVDEGGAINTQPPAPETKVLISEIGRDNETGEVTLKIQPIYGDVVRYEIGDNEPTTASASVADAPGGFKTFKTKDMCLSFKCFDTQGKNKLGAEIVWQNKILLKHRVFQEAGEWKVEFTATPKGEIRYTTDGSNPIDFGGIYDSPVVVPASSRFVLAYAKSDGIVSEVDKIDTDQYRKQENIIDIIQHDLPATWNCKKRGLTAKEAFEFIQQMEKYQGQAFGVSVEVRSNDESGEVCYDAAPETKLSAAALEDLSQHLQETFKHGQGSQRFIDIERVTLEKAQSLKDWFAAIKYQPKPGEIKQDKSRNLN
jgi:Fn3 associated